MTPQNEQLLAHVGRYRITTIDAVQALFYADKSREAARVALYRLAEEGLLTRFEIRNRSFYQLTKKGCTSIGAPRNAAIPITASNLMERYAVLCFCTLRGEGRERLTPEELRELFPELADEKSVDPSNQHFYIDRTEGAFRLGRITVDNGSDIRWLVQKCRDIVKEASTGALAALVKAGVFSLTVLTPYEVKRTRIADNLASQSFSVIIRVEVVSEMKHLL